MERFPDFYSNDGASSSRLRRAVPETGSFGKSTRRSRSISKTPGPRVEKKEDPTLAAADKIFSNYFANQAAASPDRQRKASIPSSASQPNPSLSTALEPTDGNAPPSRYIHKEPTEVILRGFKPSHQYAAIREYERIAGRICEDYPRDPPLDQRKFKSDLRDPAVLRRRALTTEEKAKALRFAGGRNWIKVTFESAEAAEAAVDSSPQTMLGYVVYAEMYRGVPPTNDEAIPAHIDRELRPATPRTRSTFPRSATTPNMSQIGRGGFSMSPPDSHASSQTLDTATMSTADSTNTASTATVTGNNFSQSLPPQPPQAESEFCHRIPTARRMKLLPAEQALLPQQSYGQRMLSKIPLVNWLSSDIIGTTIPKNENGEFDYVTASIYWRFMFWLHYWTGILSLFGGDKDD
jgi:hypothetical protein